MSGEYFSTLQVPVSRGRAIGRDDVSVPNGQPVAVIGDRLWKERLGGADVLGQSIVVSGVTATIVGIAPPGFIGTWSDARADLWLPLTMQHALGYRSNMSSYGDVESTQPWAPQDRIAWLNVIGRIPASGLAQAHAALEVANRAGIEDMAMAVDDPRFREEVRGNAFVMQPFTQGYSRLRAQLSQAFVALAAMVAIVLLVACANVANLLLARSAARAREVAIRIAVGASRARLVQQGLVESAFLATLGGAAGWVLGQWSSGILASAFLSTSREQLPDVYSPDVRVLAFTAGVSIATALLCGLLPAARTARSDSRGTLLDHVTLDRRTLDHARHATVGCRATGSGRCGGLRCGTARTQPRQLREGRSGIRHRSSRSPSRSVPRQAATRSISFRRSSLVSSTP